MNFFLSTGTRKGTNMFNGPAKKLQQIINEGQGRKWLIGVICLSYVQYSLIKRPINLAHVISDVSFWFWLSGGSFNVWNLCCFPKVDIGNVDFCLVLSTSIAYYGQSFENQLK